MRTLTFFITLLVIAGCSSSTNPVATLSPAHISAIVPENGACGTPIIILGSNFAATSELAVMIGGIVAKIDSSDPRTIWTRIPSTANPGNVDVRVISGHDTALAAHSFTVTSNPAVTTINPSSGYPGQIVEVKGSNLSQNGTPLILQIKFFGSDSIRSIQSSAPSDPYYVRVPLDAKTGVVTVSANGVVLTASGWPTFTVLQAEPLQFNSFGLSLDHVQGTTLHYNNKTFPRDSAIRLDTLSFTFGLTSNTATAVDEDTSLLGYDAMTYTGSSRSDTYHARVEAIVDTVRHVISMLHAGYGHVVNDLVMDNSKFSYDLRATNLPYAVVGGVLQVTLSGTQLSSYVTALGYAVQTSSHHGGGEAGVNLISPANYLSDSQLRITLSK